MKVLLEPTYVNMTGANQSMISLIQQLKNQDIEFLVVVPSEGPLKDFLIQNQINFVKIIGYQWIYQKGNRSKIMRMKKVLKKVLNFYHEIALFFILKTQKFDIVHINSFGGNLGYKAAKWGKIPVIWHLREFVEKDQGNLFWNKQKSLAELEDADFLITISHSIDCYYSNLINHSRKKMIYNGLAIDNQVDMNINPLENRICVLTIAGVVAEHKGQKEAILAIDELVNNKQQTDFRLRIVGDDTSTFATEMKELVKLKKLDQYVEFTGVKNNLSAIWDQTDIALICSKAEAFGRVTVEAMILGIPVIGSNTEGTKEILDNGKYGTLYNQGEFTDLAKKIKLVYDNRKSVKQKLTDIQSYAYQNYSANKTANEVFKIYERVVEDEKRA
ncbi:glycosyltransferase family 4 protein [Enterococcus sp. 5H]|uniref:glycosyltransferase family 4 protein n=1 Tax=Enterococcus sp. 5H TaxID=1229490 RepID=UPI0023025718|nr:glycosyltransferase family 4 protein [Enterococcus sp. 5H]